MTEQQQGPGPEGPEEARRRRAGVAAFVVGMVGTLAFFAFFPGLPHVIDWGAILVALVVGGLARWGCRVWVTRGR
ncbi:hypothetical protein E2C00_10045 [Streptomyces sp. WAC05374]|uniref:hypothetical protein n=1 Tax=Streptomyces sp. WAC05374 TaxID=2487420 RepID=UPI000F88F900|nr:hypothetical protein [Streptomyces sp. WAC05374]RST11124.1 hypothetical protein EF905_25815 [Streptomyces sp. WAC05374]TDF47123.1 hypothetical protein E2B92_08870 [Streptomyces sp. WAC05374]TDF57381.1 hypothetical protein E2C00_10045 [Streptomyces sp. WAC05374]TDF61486.1 hypothetical protein E2C02_01245 [Streptomyces sp. WAC05374]